MAGLVEQLIEQRLNWRWQPRSDGVSVRRPELDRQDRVVLKVKTLGPGRVEAAIRRTDCQRVLDAAMSERKRGPRRSRSSEDETVIADNVRRAAERARSAIRTFCERISADRMLTFTTRGTPDLAALSLRWHSFVRAYRKATGVDFLYCAVPEYHADGVRLHLHVATVGKFDIRAANQIWWALCATDGPEQRNGNIDIRKFSARRPGDDVARIVAGYISKYCAKSLSAAGFNKKSYWSSRIGACEVNYHVLPHDTVEDAAPEVARILGFNWQSVVFAHHGCFFVDPDDKFIWFKLTPSIKWGEPPF